MHTLKTEAVVLKRRNIGEADRLLTVLTKTHGKMQVKAPGVRKIASRRSPHIELLNRVSLHLYTGSASPIVTEAQMIADYSPIKQDLVKVGYAYHVCEITDGLCAENEENNAVFSLLIYTLDSLCLSSTNDSVSVVKEYEFQLLELLGFGVASMRDHAFFDTNIYIESLLERKLKSKDIFLQKS